MPFSLPDGIDPRYWKHISLPIWHNDEIFDTFKNEYNVVPEVFEEMEQIKKKAIEWWYFLQAPNWKPSNLDERLWLLVRTKNFKKWFWDWENDINWSSKILDKNWEPLVVYHGANTEINVFDLSKNEANVIWFTTDKEYASNFTKDLSTDSVESFFLNIRNPYGNLNEAEALEDLHTQIIWIYENEAHKNGINPDGYIGHDTYAGIKRSNWYEIAITNPNQIKSIDNYWYFSGWNNNIKY